MCISVTSWSQDDLIFLYKGNVENSDLGKKESGVTISFIQSGSTLFTATSNSSGRYTLKGGANYKIPFVIAFSKGGLVTKKVAFDFSRMHEEDIPPTPEFKPMDALDMVLFKERENVDFSFLANEPVAKIDWDTRQMTPRLDQNLVDEMKLKILKLLADADKDKAEAEINYQKAITEADNLFTEESYEASLAKYEEALGYKPAEEYPADKIIELDALIQAQKAADLKDKQENEIYYNLIAEADNLRDQDKLEQAVTKYQEALTKKEEQYPKDQIVALNKRIEDLKKEAENQAKYDSAILKGDAFLAQNSLRAAKDKFSEAQSLKPSENYPIEKLKEIEDKLKAQEDIEANKKKYDEALAAADSFFGAEKFEEAKAKYEEALSFESSSTYAKDQIGLCEDKLNELAAANELSEQIDLLIEEGNAFVSSENWEEAKNKFNEVLTLDSVNQDAIQKLVFIEAEILKAKELAEQNALELKMKESYDAAITAADNAFNTANWDEASAKYREALIIDDTQSYPSDRLSLIEEKIAEEKAKADQEAAALAKQESYDAAIVAADNAFEQANWEEASAKYREAITIDETQSYPSDRLSLIEEKIAEEKANADQEAAALAKQESYDAAIVAADNAFEQANWEEASAKYREAITIDETQSYPSDRLSLIEEKIAEEKANADQEAAALAKQESYDAAIVAADNAFEQGNWEEASAKYREAITIDETQSYPSDRLSLIEEKIAEEKANADQEAAALAKQESYDAAIVAADNAFNTANWEEASAKYREAIAIDETQSYPSDRLSLIEEKIAEEKSNADQEAAALAKKESYDAAIVAADNAFNTANWEEASAKYREALAIDDTQSYPSERLSLIEEKIAEEDALKNTEESYSQLLSEAESFVNSKSFEKAIANLEQAQILKVDESFPAKRIAEIKIYIEEAKLSEKENIKYQKLMDEGDALVSSQDYLQAITKYNEALSVKPSEQEPVDKAAEAERLEKASNSDADKQYEKIISLARKKMDEADYPKAIELLNRAKGRPSDPRPDDMLAEIKLLKLKDAQFNELIDQGDALGELKKYDEAILKFEEAGRLKSESAIPSAKIEEMKALKDAFASEAQRDELYNSYMDKGSYNLDKEEYDQALSNYQNALNVKDNDVNALAKINEIQQILDNLLNQKTAQIELQNKFDAFIVEADRAFANTDYTPAIENYEAALLLKPGNTYVQGQIDESKRQIGVLEIIAEEKAYTDLISQADSSFDNEDYEVAKSTYEEALLIKTNDVYPANRLREIELIQNPVTINGAELEDLGDPFDSSIMDGAFILAKADAERKSLKKTRIEDQLDDIQDDYTSMSSDNINDAYGTSNDIYEVYKLISVEAGEEVLGQRELADRLRIAKMKIENEESMNSIYENATSINDQMTLYDIDEKSSLVYGENTKDQQDLAETLRRAKQELENEVSSDSYKDNDKNLNDQLSLYEIGEKNELIYGENDLVQQELAETLRRAKLELENEVSSDSYKDNDKNLNDQLRLYEIGEKNELIYGENDLVQQELAETLRRAKLELDNEVSADFYTDNGKNLNDQLSLYDINEKSAIEYGEKQAVYSENTDVMNQYNTSAAKARSEGALADYSDNVSSDQELIGIRSKFSDGVVQRNKEKSVSAEQISEVSVKASDVQSKLDSENTSEILNDQVTLDQIEKSAEDQAKIESELLEFNSEVLKKSKFELAEALDNEMFNEGEKYRDSKSAINEGTKLNGEIVEIAKEAHDRKVAYVQDVGNMARVQDADAIEGDKEARMLAEREIHDSYEKTSEKSKEEEEISKENSTAMTELDRTEKASRSADLIGQTDKHYGAQANLNKVSNAPEKKPTIKNSLGEEYPEGVSQESFTRSDNNGLVTTIITRRIVVIDGHADVYVRTQSMHGITYSKNGKPSLSNVWSKDTQGPHLERHF